ncbi:MAG: DNA polymerase I [Candidatus Magasanikbacteria bacterium CG10_big_fil_rev_8_21_14_0_10_36_16]|uniref:DNA polymerase I n=1 Tax=Candidatus Magasanikbacteria bacterium CG10_big_fil_rev_8_21_14_0_10_36_16 TaxID=1974645 RepID=A0A2H0TYP2_9BACT|nr:MAG: DNA polymerase I [Candidatus Magasanikbacteria bacterium CG10_big_fil_rev_8_21_14_0_10_36_16]
MKKLVIIDGNAIVHRAYHALPPMRVKDGTVVNAVYGFASMLLKIINDVKPEYLAVSFDVAGGTFRDDIFVDYKATRVEADQALYDQFPLVYELVDAFNIPIFTKKGFEADDVMGTIAHHVKNGKTKIKTLIVTGDKDLLQLVDDKENIEIYLLKKGMSEFESCDEKTVFEKMGFAPNMVISYKSLRGDASDNIPGVKGIGDKTAVSLISKIGNIDEIYKQLKNKKSKLYQEFSASVISKLETDQTQAFMSKELATIKTDIEDIDFDLVKAETKDFDRDKVVKLFQKFEFYSLLKRLEGGKNVTTENSGNKKTKTKFSKKIINVNKDNWKEVLADIKKERIFVVKEIMQGTDMFADHDFSLLLSTYFGNYFFDKLDDKIFEIFTDSKKTLVGHDIKNLVKLLKLNNVEVKNRLFDTMIASYILNTSTRAHDLKSLALRELGREINLAENQKSLFGVNPQDLLEGVLAILEIYSLYNDKIIKEKYEDLYNNIEIALLPVLAQMELNGVFVDVDLLSDLSKQVTKEIAKLEKNIWKESGEEFNVASSTQLRDVLFEKMGLPTEGIKKGKTGYSTAASELEKLHDIHPIIDYIENFRELEKLRNTYIDVLPTLINKTTGRIHTTYNQTIASTGRLSSSEPNLQNIPIRTELGKKVREVFVAEKGHTLVAADYSQIDLRVVACLAKDEKMIDIFKSGQDIHTATAAAIHGVKLEEVDKEMRRSAKEVNFGVLFGMGAFGLSSRTGISRYEAQEFIDKYFNTFSGVKKYIEGVIEKGKKEGYVETMFGRRRYIPELISNNFQLRSSGERMAISMPVQGTEADIMKLAMIAVDKKIIEKGLSDKAKMILQVHDEIVLEVEESVKDEIAEIVKNEMQTVVKLEVPLDVEVSIGYCWGRLK